jgi:hypothetical protein
MQVLWSKPDGFFQVNHMAVSGPLSPFPAYAMNIHNNAGVVEQTW